VRMFALFGIVCSSSSAPYGCWRRVASGIRVRGRPRYTIPTKNPPAGSGRVGESSDERLGTDDVAGLKAFGAFEQIELHGLTLVERAVAVLLDSGEVYENVLSRGALDETISFRPVEPLHSSLLSHRKTPFPGSSRISFPEFEIVAPNESGTERPLRKSGETRLCLLCRRNFAPKQKTPRFYAA
jgi:hypothetical protein